MSEDLPTAERFDPIRQALQIVNTTDVILRYQLSRGIFDDDAPTVVVLEAGPAAAVIDLPGPFLPEPSARAEVLMRTVPALLAISDLLSAAQRRILDAAEALTDQLPNLDTEVDQ